MNKIYNDTKRRHKVLKKTKMNEHLYRISINNKSKFISQIIQLPHNKHKVK